MEPKRLAFRLVAAALWVACFGGMTTLGLVMLLEDWDGSPTTHIFAIALALVLVALVGWRLAAATGYIRISSSASWWCTGVAGATVLLALAVCNLPEFGVGELRSYAFIVLILAYTVVVFGLVPALAFIVTWVPALLLLRSARSRITLPTVQLMLTAFAMVVTALLLPLMFQEHIYLAVAIATPVAGIGVALTARWILEDRKA